MTQTLKRVVWLVAGWVAISVGVIGIFIPFFQGSLLIVIGLFILSSEYVWAHRLLGKIRERFPRVVGVADRVKAWAVQFARRAGTEGAQ